jgi:hypothetical protein
MTKFKLVCLIFVLLGSLTAEVGWAHGWYGGGGYHGGHFHGPWGFYGRPAVGYYFGPGFGWPYYPYYPYYPPYYAYPPTVVTVPSSPPAYIQRNHGQSVPQPQTNYWYYCRDTDGYYPYVKQCPDGWQQVPPQPSLR